LRNQKDEDEDWSRWRDVVFRAKGALKPRNIGAVPSAGQKGSSSESDRQTNGKDAQQPDASGLTEALDNATLSSTETAQPGPETTGTEHPTPIAPSDPDRPELLYCPECYLPLHPDPKPEKLYIFLHAIRYTTSLGSFETEMPEWAAKDFQWEV